LPDEPKIPKLTGAANSAALRLSAVEGFVLSRIDGKTSEAELAGLTGLNESQIRGAIDKLLSLQVITLESKPPALPPGPSGSTELAPGTPGAPGGSLPAAPGDAPAAMAVTKRIEDAIAAVPRDSPDLAEEVDLPEPLRLRILATATVLEALDYYELLNVERGGDKKAVKRCYFELASLFHPDRYFRKRLGSYKARMEAIFGRVTQAYETLSNKDQRAEYDAYLADLDRTRAIDEVLRNADEEARGAEQEAQRAAARASYSDAGPAPASVQPGPAISDRPAPAARVSGLYTLGGTAPQTTTTPAPSPLPPAAPGSPVITEQARRDVLAARLLGNRARGSLSPPTPLSRPPGDGGEMLKRRYEERVAIARKAQTEKYLGLAREAEKKNDVLGAATAYKVAIGSLPEGDPVRVAAEVVIAKADAMLADTFLRQAQYEERSEHWGDAARSWQRVAKGRPNDARAHERAANAMVLSKGDLHVAAELAKRAIAIEPKNADYKATLAAVFIEAGLGLNARRELEAAAQLSPRNANIQALLKRVNKAG